MFNRNLGMHKEPPKLIQAKQLALAEVVAVDELDGQVDGLPLLHEPDAHFVDAID